MGAKLWNQQEALLQAIHTTIPATCFRQERTDSGQSVQTVYSLNDQNRLESTEKQLNTYRFVESYFYDDAGNTLGRMPEMYSNSASQSGSISAGFIETQYRSDNSLCVNNYGGSIGLINSGNRQHFG
ncbi:MAG: hypothetical protein FWH52_06430 [Synergistaceae bacterium]|nr:hypothetical protein [Synergistaceae bacterium]